MKAALVVLAALIGVSAVFSHPSVGGLHWSSWDARQSCQPVDFFRPASEEELIAFLARVNDRHETVKVVGAGHSFSAIALSPPTDTAHMLSLDLFADIKSVDRHVDGTNFSHVTVGAGIRLYQLNAKLEELGLALQNLGATAEQSLAGATATGTHGTGNTGSLSASIVAFRLVAANGTVFTASPDQNSDLFYGGAVGLGALGVITEITLNVVDIWRMRLDLIPYDLADLERDLPALRAKHPRLQWYWTPYTPNATLVLRTPTDEPITGCWNASELYVERWLANEPLDSTKSCVDVSYKTMTGSRDHYFARSLYTEMEMFVPVDDLPAAITDFQNFQTKVRARHTPGVNLFTGVRYVEPDNLWMSPQFERRNAVISMIVTGDHSKTGSPAEFDMFARGLEAITTRSYQARPHWGKMNYANETDIATAYPHFRDFQRLREEMDPHGIFLNEYLEHLFLSD